MIYKNQEEKNAGFARKIWQNKKKALPLQRFCKKRLLTVGFFRDCAKGLIETKERTSRYGSVGRAIHS